MSCFRLIGLGTGRFCVGRGVDANSTPSGRLSISGMCLPLRDDRELEGFEAEESSGLQGGE